MTPSRRFVVASFFAAIALSVLCNSIFSIIDRPFSDPSKPLNSLALFYSVSLGMFMIKYFVDDVIDDRQDDKERITRNSLALLVLAWTFFILSALFVKDMFLSSVLWAIGLSSITFFLYKNRHLVEHHASLYLAQNGFLLATLCLLAASMFSNSMIAKSPPPMVSTGGFSMFARVMTALLTVFNVWFFVLLLRDDTEPNK